MTLHSNLVLFKFHCTTNAMPIYNALHSNLVLFKLILSLLEQYHLSSLHSNLVLFKWSPRPNLPVPYIPFTFQSGSIQMTIQLGILYVWTFFTFQSGSIQISKQVNQFSSFLKLYIPIWFYSNFIAPPTQCRFTTLYIPIWFYSNNVHIIVFHNIAILYIPIWFYSNAMLNLAPPLILSFTFQSGSIQILLRIKL